MLRFDKSVIAVLVAGLLVLLATAAAADEFERSPERLIVIDPDGVEHTITLDGSAIEIVTDDHGAVSVHAFDFSVLAPLIDDLVETVVTGVDAGLDGLAVLPRLRTEREVVVDEAVRLRREVAELRREIAELQVRLERVR